MNGLHQTSKAQTRRPGANCLSPPVRVFIGRRTNPHGLAAAKLLTLYESIKSFYGLQLDVQTVCRDDFAALQLTWDDNTETFSWDVSQVVSRVNNDLLLSFGSGDQVTIKSYFSDIYYQVEKITFADGTVWGVTDIALRQNGTGVADRLCAKPDEKISRSVSWHPS